MPKPKKEGRFLNVKLENQIYDRFEEYIEEVGQSKTTAIERILKGFLDQRDEQKKQAENSLTK